MSLFLGYRSAYEYWCHNDIRRHDTVSVAMPNTASAPSNRELNKAKVLLPFLTLPIHTVVPTVDAKRNLVDLTCHVNDSLPLKSFARISHNLYVSIPEACYVQLASQLSFVEILMLGSELCGTYAQDQSSNHLISRHPRTSKYHFEQYLNKLHRTHGKSQALRALKYICENSASPMETKLTLLLCLPFKLGGYGLPYPKLNYPLYDTKFKPKKELYRCDLCWPKLKLAIEYDSHQFHATNNKLALDSRRRIAIEQYGLHVISVTKQQVYSDIAFSELAKVISRYLGIRLRIRSYNFEQQRRKLRSELLLSV